MEQAGLRVILFDTTTTALWAEEVARERRIPAEVVPAPAGSKAGCDLALATRPDLLPALVEALLEDGVPHRTWQA